MSPAIASLFAVALAAAPDAGTEPLKRTRELMHTRVTVQLAEPGADAEAAFTAAFGIFERIEKVMNEWEPGSALSEINAQAGKQAVSAPEDLCEVIRIALDGAARTKGLFDPTWAALRDVWRFGDDSKREPPSADALKPACALVSYKQVQLTPLPKPSPQAACTVKLLRPGMKLGLGGLVKGWGVDRAVAELRRRGYRDFFVQAGGDLYLAGKNGDRAWRAGIRDPRGNLESSFARAELSDTSFSTSGDYERFFIKDGVRYHHLIDPRSCLPARASVSATVMAKTATDAEVLTKATFILGGAKGLQLAESFGASAVLVSPDGTVHVSKSLQKTLQWWPPTGLDAGTP